MKFSRTTATGLLALGLSFGVASSAFAVDDPPPVPSAPSEALPPSSKGRCVGAIKRRVVHLAGWSARISLRSGLSADQKTELLAELKFTSDGLVDTALPAVQNAPDKTAMRAACKLVVTDYRVYLVVHPRVFLTANAWGWLARITDLETQAAALKTAGKDTAAIDKLLLDARNLATPIHGQLDAITPASYNGDIPGTTALFKAAKSSLRTVEHKVKEAKKLIRELTSATAKGLKHPKKK